ANGFAVDAYAAGDDQIFAVAAGADARVGQEFVETVHRRYLTKPAPGAEAPRRLAASLVAALSAHRRHTSPVPARPSRSRGDPYEPTAGKSPAWPPRPCLAGSATTPAPVASRTRAQSTCRGALRDRASRSVFARQEAAMLDAV